VLISNNQKLQGEQSVMTNLAFALDSMTREIRTGYNYHCARAVSAADPVSGNIFDNAENHQNILSTATTTDCASGPNSSHGVHGVSFFEGGRSIVGNTGTTRILYFYDRTSTPRTIMRRVGNSPAQSIISSGLEILNAEFVVTGSTPQSGVGGGRNEQPTVTIYIQAQEIGETKTYELQTTVTQRILDL